ncbi:MAG: hypothetical protein B6I31_05510 [Desulfobacteraceae bacterium 4572_19]|nr:MAG: hypothetical protein B6I31_05510 [Desulfobacteraceae bacterium 4572_19]
MNDAGEMDTVDSKIFVLEDVVKNGYLYLGELSEVISISTPLKIEKACRIISFSKIPSLNKTNEFIRIAYSKTNIGNESGF